MTAMYQGEGDYTSVVGQRLKGRPPHPPIQAQSKTNTMSDLQFEMDNERKQHQQSYEYAHRSHSDDNLPLGKPSF